MARCCICGKTLRLCNNKGKAKVQLKRHLKQDLKYAYRLHQLLLSSNV